MRLVTVTLSSVSVHLPLVKQTQTQTQTQTQLPHIRTRIHIHIHIHIRAHCLVLSSGQSFYLSFSLMCGNSSAGLRCRRMTTSATCSPWAVCYTSSATSVALSKVAVSINLP